MAQDYIDRRDCPTCGGWHSHRVYAGKEVCPSGRSSRGYEVLAGSTQGKSSYRSYEVLGRSQAAKRSLVAALGFVLVGCASFPVSRLCSAADVPTRWTDAQIDAMSEEQVKNELARNEDLAARGCAVPNK